MKYREFFLAAVIMSAVLFLSYLHKSNRPGQTMPMGTLPESSLTTTNPKTLPETPASDSQKLEKALEQESAKIGQIADSPERTAKEIRTWAKALNQSDLEVLKNKSLNTELPGDERSLALFLLTEAAKENDRLSTLAQKQLAGIALEPIQSRGTDRSFSFEEALRAQAIDGVSKSTDQEWAKQILGQVKSKTESHFLNIRVDQNLAFLKGQGPDPETLDHQYLKSVIQSR